MKLFRRKTTAQRIYESITDYNAMLQLYNDMLENFSISKAIYKTERREHHVMIFADASMLNFTIKNKVPTTVTIGEQKKGIAKQL